MKIIVLKGTMASGQRLKPGKKAVEVSEKDARYLVATGKAKLVEKKKEKPGDPEKTGDPEKPENREDDIDVKTK